VTKRTVEAVLAAELTAAERNVDKANGVLADRVADGVTADLRIAAARTSVDDARARVAAVRSAIAAMGTGVDPTAPDPDDVPDDQTTPAERAQLAGPASHEDVLAEAFPLETKAPD